MLAKKLGGLAAIIVGFVATGIGYREQATWLMILGALIVLAGIGLLVYKIGRRNESF